MTATDDLSIDMSHPTGWESSSVEEHETTRETGNLLEILARKGMEARATAKPPTTVPNPFDPDLAVRFRVVIPQRVMKKFFNLNRQDKEAEASISLLTSQCEALILHGREIRDDTGDLLTFTHDKFSEMYADGPTNARKAIEAFYGGKDGIDGALPNIGWVVDQIFTAAGIGVQRDDNGRPLGA